MRYLFVGGSQRSGTTILQKFLCMDSRTTPKLAEASYFRSLLQAYQLGRNDFEHDTASYFDDREQFRQFHAGLLYQFLNRNLAHYPQASCLVLKEPHMTPLFPDVYELIPDAKFIAIMRDPRDIIASMLDVGQRMSEQKQQHFFQARNIEQLSTYIKSFYAPLLQCKNQGFQNSLLVIRYEDLIQNTADIKQRLAMFTGLAMDFDERQNPNSKENADAKPNQTRYLPWLTENNNKKLNNSSIGRYRQVLTEDEQQRAAQHCADLLQLFQYN